MADNVDEARPPTTSLFGSGHRSSSWPSKIVMRIMMPSILKNTFSTFAVGASVGELIWHKKLLFPISKSRFSLKKSQDFHRSEERRVGKECPV